MKNRNTISYINNINKKALMSFIIISYNQEIFIAEAIESALNQDYENLEIIISDDASTDNTWNVIKKTVSQYNGNRKIILNQNEKNLGIVSNFLKGIKLSKGEWIIGLAGDDIAYPNRASLINQIITNNDNIYLIGTNYDTINERGKIINRTNIIPYKNKLSLPFYPGCVPNFHRDCINQFPILSKRLSSEDILLSIRAFQLGGILLSNVPTIKYRIHSKNVSVRSNYSEKNFISYVNNLNNAIDTLEYCKEYEIKESNPVLLNAINNQIIEYNTTKENYLRIIEIYNYPFIKKINAIFNVKIQKEKTSLKSRIELIISLIFNNNKIILYTFNTLFLINQKIKKSKNHNSIDIYQISDFK